MTLLKKKGYGRSIFVVGILILIVIIIFAANFGVANISFKQTAMILMSRIPVINKLTSLEGIDETYQIIILNLRLPRILLAALVGAGLSVVGTSFQGIFKNPMADPYVLGISSGAALGATLTIAFGAKVTFFGLSFITINAFIGAIVTTYIVYSIARVGSKVSSVTLLLAGVASSYLLSSIISLVMIFKREDIEKIVMWTMGSLSTASFDQVLILLIVIIPSIAVIYFFSRDMNIMLLGEDSARSLGVEVEKVKKIILLISTFMVAAVVSFTGIIGFVGLIIPHTIRMIFGPSHKVLIPFAALLGAIFLIICDALARTIIPPSEIPVGIITSIFGVPFFLYLLYKTKKKVQ
jgi:iron complex transport system permease protein